MAIAPSQTGIVNKALALLGTAKRISQITENSAPAITMSALWDGARDATLADHPWNFAIRRARQAADPTAPAFGYAFQYALPGDCLRWLPWARGEEGWFEGEQEGAYILSDAIAPLNIRYIARIEDMGAWSMGFIDAIAARLAWEGAEAITGGLEGVVDRMSAKYQAALDAAKRQDALASTAPRVEAQSDWLAARHGYGRRR